MSLLQYSNGLANSSNWYQITPSTYGWSSETITVTMQSGETVAYSGNKPVVICNGQAVEVKDLDEAQAKAEQLAHQHQADAYILKPIKKVAPKREVVTTEL